MGKVAKGVGGVAVVGIAALLYFGPGQGWFPGVGTGSGEGETTAQSASSALSSVEAEIPDNILITIEEEVVTINGVVVESAEELKKFVEEYNTDARTFQLEENHSIKESYDWVKGVFEELGITLVE
ncbi:MAG: hypothetical protein IJR00_12875 [Lachnospiraceae bacterium]|nr:hypothetical protein [Lachnospiraceae bacterium]